LFKIAFGFGGFWWAWDLWGKFAQFESGQLESLKIWAPLAWIYNIGGVGSTIGKWGAIALALFVGVGFLGWGIAQVRGSARQPVSDVHAPADSIDYEAQRDIQVTPSQIASEEVLQVSGPNGNVAVQLRKTMRDKESVRFPGEGLYRKGDLRVVIHVKE
jgi:hypothetical protein